MSETLNFFLTNLLSKWFIKITNSQKYFHDKGHVLCCPPCPKSESSNCKRLEIGSKVKPLTSNSQEQEQKPSKLVSRLVCATDHAFVICHWSYLGATLPLGTKVNTSANLTCAKVLVPHAFGAALSVNNTKPSLWQRLSQDQSWDLCYTM